MNLIGRTLAIDANDLKRINPLTEGSLSDKIAAGINAALWFAGALAVIYLVYGGILYITAGGDAEKATKGRTALINAIIGVIVILLALLILAYIKDALGASSGSPWTNV